MITARGVLVAGVVTLVVAAAACGGDKRDSKKAERSPTAVSRTRLLAVADQPAAVDRQVIFTADLVVRVSTVADASRQAQEAVRGAGGYVFAQDSDVKGSRQARLTLKVPPERFDTVLATLS